MNLSPTAPLSVGHVPDGMAYQALLRWQNGQQLKHWGEAMPYPLLVDVGALQAALYVLPPDGEHLQLVATAAGGSAIAEQVPLGVGFVGQTALGEEPLHLHACGAFERLVFSSLMHVQATALLMLPLRYQGQLAGVLELCSHTAFSAPVVDWLWQLVQQMAASLLHLRAQRHMQSMYESVQELWQ